MRLLGFERVQLKPGEKRQVTITAEPRLLARFDGKAGKWTIADGTHQVAVAKSATDLVLTGNTRLSAREFGS
jgi:beta-glucosidase